MKVTSENIYNSIKKHNFTVAIVASVIFLILSVFYFLGVVYPVYDQSNSIYNISNLKEMNPETLKIIETHQYSNQNSSIDSLPPGRVNPFYDNQ